MESNNVINPTLPLPFDPEFLARKTTGQKPTSLRRRSKLGPRTAVGAPGYLSVRRAAEVLGLQPRSVIYLLQQGLIISQRLGRAHFISTAEVERYRRVRRDRAARARLRQARGRRIKLVR